MNQTITMLSTGIMLVISSLFGEILLWMLFDTRGGLKFRWGSVQGHSNLIPYVKTWKLVLVFILASVIVIPILVNSLWQSGIMWLNTFEWYLVSVLIIVLCVTYLWTKIMIINKDFNSGDMIPVILIILTGIITWILQS